MTRTWIIKNAHTILTMDDTRRELNRHDILLRDGVISEIGENIPVPAGAEIVDAQNAVVTPGLVNTHHHLYQSLTRAVPGGWVHPRSTPPTWTGTETRTCCLAARLTAKMRGNRMRAGVSWATNR